MAGKSRKDRDSTSDKLTYEELRRKTIEENRKRLEELGLLEQASLFKKKPSTPRKTVKIVNPDSPVETRRSPRVARRPAVNYCERSFVFHREASPVRRTPGTRRSLRMTRNPSVNYNESKIAADGDDDEDEEEKEEESPGRRNGIGRQLERGFISVASRTEATVKAEEVTTKYPSFVKAMLKSHVSGGFWLGLPSAFCDTHFSKDDLVVLEDENGFAWEAIYLHHKRGLSGGWRGFSLDHGLEDGDSLVFELVNPTRFKVYITRAVDKRDEKTTPAKKLFRYALKENKENEHVNSALHKDLKREQLRTEESVSRECAENVQSSRKRKLDLSEPNTRQQSGGQLLTQAGYGLVETSKSDDGCTGDATFAEDDPAESGHHQIRRNEGSASEVVLKSATSRKSKKGGRREGARLFKTKMQSTKVGRGEGGKFVNKFQKSDSDYHKEQGSRGNPTPADNEDKGVVLKKKARVTRKMVEPKIAMQVATQKTRKLPPGAKIKAVGFCSIVGNDRSGRKLPSYFLA